MKEHKAKNIFVEGAIPSSRVGEMIGKHQTQTNIGAHDIFLGQVRADEKEGGRVISIEYTTYEEMANQVFQQIKDDLFSIGLFHLIKLNDIIHDYFPPKFSLKY